MKLPRFNVETGRWLRILVLASLVIGIALRFLWTSDIEFKGDEHYMFARSLAVGVSEPWPWLGMPSGVGLRNPGMSIWVFVALARVFRTTTPVGLAQAVIFLNCLALVILAVLVFRLVAKQEREPWIWALALIAVNPVAIQLQRKIWAQSVLPLFCVLLLWAWLRREKRVGAFLWGFLGALIGQIHMSGFFFAAAVLLWTGFASGEKRPRWREWFWGSVLGSLTLLPWIQYALAHAGEAKKPTLLELLQLGFLRNWLLEPVGISIWDSLGIRAVPEFLRSPGIGGVPTCAVGVASVVAAVSGIWIVLIGLAAVKPRLGKWRAWVLGATSESDRILCAGFWGYGGMLALGKVLVARHYLIVAAPLQYLSFGRVALFSRSGRALLLVLWLSLIVISSGFLYYIHVHGGSPGGDYGVAYAAQR